MGRQRTIAAMVREASHGSNHSATEKRPPTPLREVAVHRDEKRR